LNLPPAAQREWKISIAREAWKRSNTGQFPIAEGARAFLTMLTTKLETIFILFDGAKTESRDCNGDHDKMQDTRIFIRLLLWR
jgi:hypothetical protein